MKEWSKDLALIARLKTLWGQGASASEAAADLGGNITPGAVYGQIRRLGLPKRQRNTNQHTVRALQIRMTATAPKPSTAKDDSMSALMALGNGFCQYPIGDVGMPGFHFCGKVQKANKPYCPDCCDKCYQPPRLS